MPFLSLALLYHLGAVSQSLLQLLSPLLSFSGIITYEKTSYQLRMGRCQKRLHVKRIATRCPRGAVLERHEPCDRRTCLQRSIFRLHRRVRCRCHRSRRMRVRRCCCPKARSRIHCEKHRLVVRRSLHFRLKGQRCLAQRRKRIIRTLKSNSALIHRYYCVRNARTELCSFPSRMSKQGRRWSL